MSVVSAVISAYTLGLVPTSKAEYGWSNLDNSLMFAVVGVIFVPGAWFAVWAAARVSSRFAILVRVCVHATTTPSSSGSHPPLGTDWHHQHVDWLGGASHATNRVRQHH